MKLPSWLPLALVLVVDLWSASAEKLVQAGVRAEGCAFAYNNRFYTLGGWQGDSSPKFMSVALPLNTSDPTPWVGHPPPEAWQVEQNGQKATCAMSYVTKKVYLFGNGSGVSSFDLVTNTWSIVDFASAPLTIPQFRTQKYISASTHLDGSTISIMLSNPPTYVRFSTLNNSVITAASAPTFYNLTGFCNAVHPVTDQFVACGGSVDSDANPNQDCNNTCTVFAHNGQIVSQTVGLTYKQYDCSMVPSENSLVIIPGMLDVPVLYGMKSFPKYNLPFEVTNGTSLPKFHVNNTSYGKRFGMLAATMPGTGKAIIYGGWTLTVPSDDNAYLLTLQTYALDLKTLKLGTFVDKAAVLPTYASPSTSIPTTTTSTSTSPESTSSGDKSESKNTISPTLSLAGWIVAGLVAFVAAIFFVRQRRRNLRIKCASCQSSPQKDPQEKAELSQAQNGRTVQIIPDGCKQEFDESSGKRTLDE